MAKPVSCTVEGLDELEHALLDTTVKKARKGMREALNAAGEVMRAAIEEKAPRRTGFLSSHIITKVKLSAKEDEGTVSVGPSKEAFYGVYDEFGTRHMAARPFMRPAFEQHKEPMLDAFVKRLQGFFGL